MTEAELDAAIAPALELAIAVARASESARPALPVPRVLRPMVGWARLPARAWPAVRRALDEDEDFRSRVATAADLVELPRAAQLYLQRPDGWRAEVEHLAAAQAATESEADGARVDRGLQRKLAGAESALARSQQAAAAAREDARRAAAELADERRARRVAEERAESLARRLRSLEQERDAAQRRAVETALLGAEVDRLVHELEGVRAVDVEAARVAVAEAAEATAAVAQALAAAGGVLGQPGIAGAAPEVRGDAVAPLPPAAPGGVRADLGGTVASVRSGRPTPSRTERAERLRSPPRRQPVPLPPAVFEDSDAAAEHLVRVPRMLVLVDGYNATLAAWPDLPIAAQRARLIDACGELVARSAAEVLIVFDGSDEAPQLPAGGGTRRGLRWRFSPADVEADDVLLEIVSDLDPRRPVTVASSDRRVREGARGLGANAISTPQLFRALRRDVS